MQVIRSTDYRRMPWKNGGGETTEVAISPAGAALDHFDWRVSMAHVATAGPFSIFPGVDRTLAVIEGAGITLRLAGRGAVRLGRDAPPYAFPADLPVDAALVDGAIDDLNVMTRRGRCRHFLSRMRIAAAAVLPRHGDTTLVMTRLGGSRVHAGRHKAILAAQDAVVLDRSDGTELEIVPDAEAELLVIDIWRC